MNKKSLSLNSLNAFALGCLTITPSDSQAQTNQRDADERPNILFILADDMGKDCLGTYGSTYDTPNLDRLASEGVQFNCASSMPLKQNMNTNNANLDITKPRLNIFMI